MAKPAKKFKDSHDPMFSVLAKEVAYNISIYKDGKGNKEHFQELVAAEKAFHEHLLSNPKLSTEIYKRFIQEIRLVNKNILSARPYFRETADNFSLNITPALKLDNPDAMKPFQINFHFVKFAKDKWKGLWTKKCETLFKRVEHCRTVLIALNFPLVINRAKLFFRKTPKGHLTFMDMIEVSSLGLCAGIDKYCGIYRANFIGVCIGRIVGNLIDAYSETALHFYPNDRRILYRANSIRGRQGITDIPDLCKAVNDSFAQDLIDGKTAPPVITESNLAYLMAAASPISSDSNVGEEGFGVYDFTSDGKENAEEMLSNRQETETMIILARKLPILNRKVLRLKGIEI